MQGSLSALGRQPRVTVVGSRGATPYGRGQARRLGRELAAAGVAVVSGAARGVDQEAHLGALEVDGSLCIAVLGSGIDRPYPREAVPLLEAIARAGGAVLSEFPCGTGPRRESFPRRNRILAALAEAVVVVQAGLKSGSMITVGHALDLGREVWALPGPVDCELSAGPHRLLAEGARLLDDPATLLEDLGAVPASRSEARAGSGLLDLLEHGPQDAATLAGRLGRDESGILLELMELEIAGRVRRLPGGLYDRSGR